MVEEDGSGDVAKAKGFFGGLGILVRHLERGNKYVAIVPPDRPARK